MAKKKGEDVPNLVLIDGPAEKDDLDKILTLAKEAGIPQADEVSIAFIHKHMNLQKAIRKSVGRPSRYKSEYAELVKMLGGNGYSDAQIASCLNISRATLFEWARQHEEFSTALTLARESAQAWWEMMGMAALFADKFNSAVWSKTMSARFRNDYTTIRWQPKDTELAPEGEEVEVQAIRISARSLSPEQRDLVRQALIEAQRVQEESED